MLKHQKEYNLFGTLHVFKKWHEQEKNMAANALLFWNFFMIPWSRIIIVGWNFFHYDRRGFRVPLLMERLYKRISLDSLLTYTVLLMP